MPKVHNKKKVIDDEIALGQMIKKKLQWVLLAKVSNVGRGAAKSEPPPITWD